MLKAAVSPVCGGTRHLKIINEETILSMRYYIIAGEASGDIHGANLMKGLLKNDPEAEFRFWGGDRMAEAGGAENLVRHYKTASFFGLMEVVKNLPTIFRQLKECKKDVAAYNPDVLILVDYPGFNFKIAKFAHEAGITVYYYISPKVWAWKESRVKRIRRDVDRLFIIFPFETGYFREKGVEAVFEGNPLVDVVEQQKAAMPSRSGFFRDNGIPDDKPIIGLLAGSRRTEIKYNLPFMVELSRKFPEYRFVVAGVKWLDKSVYDEVLAGSDVLYVCDQTYPVLAYSEAAVVTSGTATLETALLGTPEMVCYRKDELSMRIGKLLVKVGFISLVNLIMDREVVRELIQWDMTIPNAEAELRAILPGGSKREKMLADYDELREAVGGPGASERFARRMVEFLREDKKKKRE